MKRVFKPTATQVEEQKVREEAMGSRSAAEIRMQKELSDLELCAELKMAFPNKDDVLQFTLGIEPATGMWKGARYGMSFKIPDNFPHSPPIVKCHTKIYHPNIDLEGNVCMKSLREDWNPTIPLSSLLYGLLQLFHAPNPLDPLNHEAAELMRHDEHQFARIVSRTLQGHSHGGEDFPKLV